MDYIREILPSDVVGKFITLPTSMIGKNLEIIILPEKETSVTHQLRGIIKSDMSLEEVREERLSKYEIAT